MFWYSCQGPSSHLIQEMAASNCTGPAWLNDRIPGSMFFVERLSAAPILDRIVEYFELKNCALRTIKPPVRVQIT